MARRTLASLVQGVDAMAFDCDGVLVDVSESYDRAIALTVARLLGGLGVPARLEVDRPLIGGLKATGGFNDEVDLAYAATLCAAAAASSGRGAREVVMGACDSLGPAGVAGVEGRLAGVADISPAVRELGHPGPASRVRGVFNGIFYGPAAPPPGGRAPGIPAR